MDNEELEDLLRELVLAAVTIADNVETIARAISREDDRHPDIWSPEADG